jgi:hypothetical protein
MGSAVDKLPANGLVLSVISRSETTSMLRANELEV